MQMPPAHDDTAYHTEGVDHLMLGWYANLYPTMRIKKMLPDFVPYPHCWQVDGSCAPIRKSVSFMLDHLQPIMYVSLATYWFS